MYPSSMRFDALESSFATVVVMHMQHDNSGQVSDANTDGSAAVLCFPLMNCCIIEMLRQCNVALMKYGIGTLLCRSDEVWHPKSSALMNCCTDFMSHKLSALTSTPCTHVCCGLSADLLLLM